MEGSSADQLFRQRRQGDHVGRVFLSFLGVVLPSVLAGPQVLRVRQSGAGRSVSEIICQEIL